jgi:hypothetical protein
MTPAFAQALPEAVTYPAYPAQAPIHLVPRERRSRIRFPVDLPFCYRSLNPTLFSGEGSVLNMSSHGALVVCRHQLTAGTMVELTIQWPARLDGWIPLQLVIVGRIVRCEISGFAVAFRHQRFRLAVPVSPPDYESGIVSEVHAIPVEAGAANGDS